MRAVTDWQSSWRKGLVVEKIELQLSVVGEIEKELDGALPYGDDMVRAERLRRAACPAKRNLGEVSVWLQI